MEYAFCGNCSIFFLELWFNFLLRWRQLRQSFSGCWLRQERTYAYFEVKNNYGYESSRNVDFELWVFLSCACDIYVSRMDDQNSEEISVQLKVAQNVLKIIRIPSQIRNWSWIFIWWCHISLPSCESIVISSCSLCRSVPRLDQRGQILQRKWWPKAI